MTTIEILGVDPRSTSLEKIVPPRPLHLVSRKALKRIKDRVAIPISCNYCGGEVRLVVNSEIYNGVEYGRWPFAYLCSGCKAYVGVHEATDIPLGTLADKETRDARKTAKNLFFEVVRSKFQGDRNKAYPWLARQINIDPKYCHFGIFTKGQCAEVEHFLLSLKNKGTS